MPGILTTQLLLRQRQVAFLYFVVYSGIRLVIKELSDDANKLKFTFFDSFWFLNMYRIKMFSCDITKLT